MKFDVLVMGGASGNTPIVGFESIFSDTCVKRNFDVSNRNEPKDKWLIRMNGVKAHLWGPRDTANGLDPKQRELFKNHISVKAQDYMIEGRNALLIIYFIQPDKNYDVLAV